MSAPTWAQQDAQRLLPTCEVCGYRHKARTMRVLEWLANRLGQGGWVTAWCPECRWPFGAGLLASESTKRKAGK